MPNPISKPFPKSQQSINLDGVPPLLPDPDAPKFEIRRLPPVENQSSEQSPQVVRNLPKLPGLPPRQYREDRQTGDYEVRYGANPEQPKFTVRVENPPASVAAPRHAMPKPEPKPPESESSYRVTLKPNNLEAAYSRGKIEARAGVRGQNPDLAQNTEVYGEIAAENARASLNWSQNQTRASVQAERHDIEPLFPSLAPNTKGSLQVGLGYSNDDGRETINGSAAFKRGKFKVQANISEPLENHGSEPEWEVSVTYGPKYR